MSKTPKYQQMMGSLRAEISAGKFGPGAKLPSEAGLVKRFKTSRITVGRALRELQNEGIIDRVAGSGSYVRLREARRAGLTFGLLAADLGQVEVLDAICQGIAEAPESDHALLWPHADRMRASKEERTLELCEQLIRRKVSGVFFAPLEFELSSEKTNRQVVKRLQESGVPVVLLDRRVGPRVERTRLDIVGINNWQVAYLATEHLIKQGLKRIAFLGYHAAQATVSGRMSGYQEALQHHDLSVQVLEDVSQRRKSLEGFVCVNDWVAAQLIRGFLGAGTRVPGDIRVVGIDDASYASLLPVPLTTVRQPCREIGEMALRTMLDRIDRPKGPARELLLDGQLVVRDSSGARVEADEEG